MILSMMSQADSLLFDSAFCSRLGLMLLHSFWQVALLAMVAWGVERFWLKRSVEGSYWVYVAALVLALLAMPVTFGLLGSGGEWGASRAAEAVSPGDASALNSFLLQAVPSEIVGTQANMPAAFPASTETLPAQVLAPTVWQRAAPWLVVAYGLGVVLMLVRLVRAWVSSNRLGSRAEKIVDGPLVETLRSLARRWSMRVVPMLAETQEMLLPKVVGLARPMILLPTAAIAGLSPDELEMILAHELAHVRRHDMWVNLLQRLAEVVLFFNPALWYLSRRISTLREYCCDEMTCELMANAASKTESKTESRTASKTASKNDPEPQLRYATALLHVAELAQPNAADPSDLAALAATGHSPSELRRRVARLFGEPMREPVRVTRSGLFTLVAITLLIACGPAIWQTEAQTAGKTTASAEQEVQLADLARNKELVAQLKKQCPFVGEVYGQRGRIKYLKSLDLHIASEAALNTLGKVQGLEVLSLTANDLRTPAFEAVGKLTSLKRLKVISFPFLPAQLAAIQNLTELEHLDVVFTIFEESKESRAQLLGDLSPEELQMRDALKLSGKGDHIIQAALLTDRAMPYLSKLTKLKTLDLTNTFFTPVGLEHLKPLVELELLHVGVVDFSDKSAILLQRMSKLRSLRYLNVNDKIVAQLSKISSLEELDIWSGDVTDVGASDLAKLIKLRRLEIRGNQMTDKGLEAISRLPLLTHLDLTCAKSITPQGVARFRKQRPNVEIEFEEKKVPSDAPATISGKIVLEDGTPSTAKGQLFFLPANKRE